MLIDLARIRRLMGFGNVEGDVDDEIRFHLESRVADLIRLGHDPADARRIARQEFGDVSAARDELANVDRGMRARDVRAARWDALRHDLHFSIRSLARAPGLTALVVTLLALGVGANAATFAVADELFLRPPAGVMHAAELQRLRIEVRRSGSVFSYPAYVAMAEAIGTRAALAGYVPPDSIDARVGGTRGIIRISYVTPNFFTVVGTRMARGRPFSEAEGRMGEGAMVAVISDALRRARFAPNDEVIGKDIQIGDQHATVIGVASPEFSGVDLDRADIWLPFATMPVSKDPNWFKDWRIEHSLGILARAAAGVSMRSITAIATVAYRNGERANVDVRPDTSATVRTAPLLETLGASSDASIAIKITTRLAGVALMVLIIACANVANLLLLRGIRRRHETAVRIALGISRQRLLRQLTIEALVLSLGAALVATLIAAWGATALRSMILPSVHWAAAAITMRTVVSALVIAIIGGVAASVVAAMGAYGMEEWSSLKATARNGGARQSRLRETLIVVQGALSVVLLVGAGLFVQSLRAVQGIDLGYDVDRLAYGEVAFRDPNAHYVDWFSGARREEIVAGFMQIAQRLRRSENVERATLSDDAPLSSASLTAFYYADGRPTRANADGIEGVMRVAPEYFATVGVALVRGRFLTAQDTASTDPVVLVNETAARRLWPGEDAVGQCLRIASPKNPCARVVGVTRDAHFRLILEQQSVQLFQPLRRGKEIHPMILLRARKGRTEAAAAELRREIAATFPAADAPYVRVIADELEPQLRPWRLGAQLFGTFGVLALIVTAIGIYSVMAFAVGQRTHEMGVRLALGARGDDIARLVLVQGLAPVIVGLLIGVALAMVMSGVVSGMLFGVTPADPFVVGTVAALILVTALLGAAEPGWRAARVNPIDALRSE